MEGSGLFYFFSIPHSALHTAEIRVHVERNSSREKLAVVHSSFTTKNRKKLTVEATLAGTREVFFSDCNQGHLRLE